MIRVGFILSDIGDRWLGGVNYYKNLFSALELLEDRKLKPVVFLGTRAPESLARNFKSVEIVRSKILDRMTGGWLLRKVVSRLMPERRDPLLYTLLRLNKIDVVSHYHYGSVWWGGRIKTIGWIPDFQHLYYPDFFLPNESSMRNVQYGRVCRYCDRIILSSEAVLKDLISFAPNAIPRSRVLRFVPDVSLDGQIVALADLKKKYGFEAPFFFLPNQFHIHKNHGVVIDALGELKKRGIKATVLSTGNTADYRRPDYFPTLLERVKAKNVSDSFKVVGVVPYEDLMSFMYHSVALINPSLFEGWSTTVEEAKALKKSVLLSDIPVHREQNPEHGFYFDPTDAFGLAQKMTSILNDSSIFTPVCAGTVDNIDNTHRHLRADFARRYQDIVVEVVAPLQKN